MSVFHLWIPHTLEVYRECVTVKKEKLFVVKKKFTNERVTLIL